MRGYSSECEALWVAADDTEDESTQPNDFATLWHNGSQSLNSHSSIIVQHTVDADGIDFPQDLVDLDGGHVTSEAYQNHVICDSVMQDALMLSGDGSSSS